MSDIFAKRSRKSSRRLIPERLEARLTLSHAIPDHIHADLSILLDGDEVHIPANIGLGAGGHFNPHTHDNDSVLHIGEGGPAGLSNELRYVTLEDFFDVWRERGGLAGNNPDAIFNENRIMDRTVDANHTITMMINGELNQEYEEYIPHDGDDIEIRFETIATLAAPTLLPESDSGYSNTDGITRDPNWRIQVDGITPGVSVELLLDGAVVDQVTETGASAIFTVDASAFSDGVKTLTARQAGTTSLEQQITFDRVAPTQLEIGQIRAGIPGSAWSLDIDSSEEGTPGFFCEIVSAPDGMSDVSPTEGSFTWLPDEEDVGLHDVIVRANDAAGNSREKTFAVYVVDPATPWQNPANPFDINGDTHVLPRDALLMINQVNQHGTDLPFPGGDDAPPPFFDTTGDNKLFPRDILLVFNFLNSDENQAEGESIWLPLDSSMSTVDQSPRAFLGEDLTLQIAPHEPSHEFVPTTRPIPATPEPFERISAELQPLLLELLASDRQDAILR